LGDNRVTVIEGQVPYTFVSDRNQKENFQPVDGEAVLKSVSRSSNRKQRPDLIRNVFW
jgi:hypothetical protein